jgi:hypothetical protein
MSNLPANLGEPDCTKAQPPTLPHVRPRLDGETRKTRIPKPRGPYPLCTNGGGDWLGLFYGVISGAP